MVRQGRFFMMSIPDLLLFDNWYKVSFKVDAREFSPPLGG